MTIENENGNTFYESKGNPNYTDVRSYVMPYIGQRGGDTWLCMRYNYTGDRYIYFNKISFNIDGAKYSMDLRYYTVTRKNNSSSYWEYVNTGNTTETDYGIFWMIGRSINTTVRFEGSNGSYEFTVSEADKQAIRDIMTAYDLMR